MRISTFVSAAFGLALFTASTQALPTPNSAVDLLKRGDDNIMNSLVKLFVKEQSKLLVDACVDLQTNVCADVIVKVNANVNVLGIKSHVEVKDLEVRTKVDSDAEVKALINADVNTLVIANIDAHVRAVVGGICSVLDHACLKKNAHTIVADVVALINVDIQKLIVQVKADVAAHVKVRVTAHLKKLAVNAGIAKADVSAIVRLRSDIDVHLKAFVKACAEVLVDAKLIAKVAAL
ncbi:hypothetical protein BGZ80_005766 [Entomortierella chlamydospora]|uniref:Uncharacterized protein n=1 Tax=Entomortierella chlamydospora TaxID=101097 RepID=A0A9P6MJJ0_9FUNG|nr:hypothetical protein BGZ79_004210 [Entomortierella chlamydospora]KAG0003623.1 hypothetical protein BGZ80_005766 [Entomortierella chlamydospora]